MNFVRDHAARMAGLDPFVRALSEQTSRLLHGYLVRHTETRPVVHDRELAVPISAKNTADLGNFIASIATYALHHPIRLCKTDSGRVSGPVPAGYGLTVLIASGRVRMPPFPTLPMGVTVLA